MANFDEEIAKAIARRAEESEALKMQDIGGGLAYALAGAERPKDGYQDRQTKAMERPLIELQDKRDFDLKDRTLTENIAQRAEEAAGRREDRQIQREQTAAIKGQAREDRKTEHTNKDVEGLSKRLGDSGLNEIDSIAADLESNGVIGDKAKGDVSGFGLTQMLPDMLISDKGQKTRQAVSALKNTILKARSGGSVTPNEAERMLAELGDGFGRSDDQLKNGVASVLRQLKAKAGTITAGTSPDAVDEYKRRGGKIPSLNSERSGNAVEGSGMSPEQRRARIQELRSKLGR